MYEGQTVSDNNITWKVKNVSNKPHSLPYIGGGGIINSREIITSSCTWTAPVDGWYQFILKGAGGGGSVPVISSTYWNNGGGGAEGGTSFVYEYMNEGDTATVTIGAGGIGGKRYPTSSSATKGGDTIIIVNNNTYTAYGGNYGDYNASRIGGSGDIPGCSSPCPTMLPVSMAQHLYGTHGAGSGGGAGYPVTLKNGTMGGGGAGAYSQYSAPSEYTDLYNAGDGGDGYVWILYFDPNK